MCQTKQLIIKIKTMNTLKELINAAQEKGIKFESYSSAFYNRGGGMYWDAKDKFTTYFGFTLDSQTYYWFKGYSIHGYKTDMNFSERYNAGNGYSISTYKRQVEALKILGLY